MTLRFLNDQLSALPRPPSLPEGWRLCGKLDAMEELPRRIAVDPELLTFGRMVCEARLPLEPQGATLQAGSCSLLLGAAVVLLADATPDEDALLAFARQLRFHPENFRRSRPVLSEIAMDGAMGRIVRDGAGQRAYFLGSPRQLAAKCEQIWDGQPRPMTADDLARMPEDTPCRYALATAAVANSQAEGLVYLGCLTTGDAPNAPLLSSLRMLESEGVEVFTWDGAPVPDTLLVSSEDRGGLCMLPPAPDAGSLHEAFAAAARYVHDRGVLKRRLLRRIAAAGALCLLLTAVCALFLHRVSAEGMVFACMLMLLPVLLQLWLSPPAVLAASAGLCVLLVLLTPLNAASGTFSLAAGLLNLTLFVIVSSWKRSS